MDRCTSLIPPRPFWTLCISAGIFRLAGSTMPASPAVGRGLAGAIGLHQPTGG